MEKKYFILIYFYLSSLQGSQWVYEILQMKQQQLVGFWGAWPIEKPGPVLSHVEILFEKIGYKGSLPKELILKETVGRLYRYEFCEKKNCFEIRVYEALASKFDLNEPYFLNTQKRFEKKAHSIRWSELNLTLNYTKQNQNLIQQGLEYWPQNPFNFKHQTIKSLNQRDQHSITIWIDEFSLKTEAQTFLSYTESGAIQNVIIQIPQNLFSNTLYYKNHLNYFLFSRKKKIHLFDEKEKKVLRNLVLAHELGHAFGLAHNFRASLVYPEMISIMDYWEVEEFLLTPHKRVYDEWALNYLYEKTQTIGAYPFCSDEERGSLFCEIFDHGESVYENLLVLLSQLGFVQNEFLKEYLYQFLAILEDPYFIQTEQEIELAIKKNLNYIHQQNLIQFNHEIFGLKHYQKHLLNEQEVLKQANLYQYEMSAEARQMRKLLQSWYLHAQPFQERVFIKDFMKEHYASWLSLIPLKLSIQDWMKMLDKALDDVFSIEYKSE